MEGTEPGTGVVDVRQSELSQVQCPGRGAEPRSMSMGRMCVSLGMRELWTGQGPVSPSECSQAPRVNMTD